MEARITLLLQKSEEKRMQEIDIERIMEEIRADIREKGYTQDMLSFADVPMRRQQKQTAQGATGSQLADLAGRMREKSYINWRRPVPAGFKGLVKRIIYKCTGFVVAPITEEQVICNETAAESVEQLCRVVQEQQKGMDEMDKRIRQMEQRILTLERKR